MRFPLFLWLLMLHSLSVFSIISRVSVHGRCLHDQELLLLQLKGNLSFSTAVSIAPASASNLSSWNASDHSDCCYWEGVYCDADGHVIGLDLSSKLISGGIDDSSSLFKLHYLEDLNLAYNTFNASRIPSGFSQLLNLTSLNLSNSGFAGQIPIEISRLTRLVSLDLSSLFTGQTSLKLEQPDLRALVQNLTGLTTLCLDGANISAQGTEWCWAVSSALPNLQVLSLSNCHLSGPLDLSLSNLRSLSDIRLNLNNISSNVPEFFASFTNLTSLHLSSCRLIGEFPEKIFQLSKLQTFDLSLNPLLSGSFPEFPEASSFQNMVLSHTSFTGALPVSIGNLKFLSKLEIDGCNFYGSIPSSLVNLTKLVSLDFSFNNFTGPISGLPENLTQINLSNNRLNGSMSSFRWDKLVKLADLDLRRNSLSGTIPLSLFTLPSLQKLQLAHNQLVGSLSGLHNASLAPLETLDLSSNKLEGPIPPSIFQFQGLNILALSSNKFNGTVQLEMIQKLNNLSNLDLSYSGLVFNTSASNSTLLPFPQIGTLKLASCNLTEFPDFLKTNQSILSHLDLSANKIQGVIPSWIWNISNGVLIHLNLSYNSLAGLEQPLPNLSSSSLAIIDLHSNLFQGSIPILSSVATYLDYSNNRFNSSIPSNISSYLMYTIFFSLSSNKLVGEIPESICNAGYLQVLDLSNNSLSGTIPSCLGSVSKTLRVLNLHGNNFSGSIPQTFPDGCSLRTLDLNGNRLGGRVSTTLANCTMLEVLDLGNNQINDTFPFCLVKLPQLRVLVLRSNNFYGSIINNSLEANHTFPMLQIIDLSSNKFKGYLPSGCFLSWKAMKVEEDETQSKFKHDELKFRFLEFSQGGFYQDTVTVTSKGLEMQLVKILTIFTSIDLSSNEFEGDIPQVIGNLTSLYVLNLSHNALSGPIPSSLGNIKQLESLDLSDNMLTGEIPSELAGLTFLSYLDLSWNNLVGMIPQGSQMQTFTATSFLGNLGLCGPPLLKNCTVSENSLPQQRLLEKSGVKFDWEFISTGLGFGGGAGVVVGPLVFWKRGRKWYDEHVDRLLFMILSWLGLVFADCNDGRIQVEETMEEELTEMTGDCDNDEEEDGDRWGGRFCVFCSKLDISGRKAIHNPDCSCYTSSSL